MGTPPKTCRFGSSATVGLPLDRYLDVADLEVSTREAHEGYIRRTINPVLGEVRVRKLRADALTCALTRRAALSATESVWRPTDRSTRTNRII